MKIRTAVFAAAVAVLALGPLSPASAAAGVSGVNDPCPPRVMCANAIAAPHNANTGAVKTDTHTIPPGNANTANGKAGQAIDTGTDPNTRKAISSNPLPKPPMKTLKLKQKIGTSASPAKTCPHCAGEGQGGQTN